MRFFISYLLSVAFLVTSVFSCSHEYELDAIFSPLPPISGGDNTEPYGWQIEHFGGGAYMVTEGVYQALFVVSTDGVILVDAPPTIGPKIGYAISNVTHLPVTHFVYSHSHADHAAGAYLYANNNVQIIGQDWTARKLAEASDKKRPVPRITFPDNYTLKVGNQTLELSYKGENHELGNIFIYAPCQKVLMLVDVVFPGWVPFAQLAVSTNIPGWVNSHYQILQYDFEYYIGGHIGRSGNRADVETQLEYVMDLLNNCNKTITLSGTDDPVVGTEALLGKVSQLNPGNYWAEFKAYLDITAEYCANVTNEKWLGVLGGADVFGFENAYTMIESLRIDWDNLGPFGG